MIDKSKTTATLATIPGREDELRLCLDSLLPQFDAVHVVFNYGHAAFPVWLPEVAAAHPNLHPAVSDNTWGDAAKFAFSQQTDGYQFFCDDDLVYPPDYAATMVAEIEFYHRKAAVSMAGSIVSGHIDSYYSGRLTVGHCLHPQSQDVPVNVLGTGVLAFHSDLMRIYLDNAMFPTSNMADVHFAVYCQFFHIPMVCVAHEPLVYPESMRGKWTIWDEAHENPQHDAAQVARCNLNANWQVFHVS